MGLNSQTMVLKKDYSLYGWGVNSSYELGLGDTVQRNSPTNIGLNEIKKVISARGTTFVLTKSGEIKAWGYNSGSDFGFSTPTSVIVPSVIATEVFDFDNMYDHTVILKKNGEIHFSGMNASGQFGDGTTTNSDYFKKSPISNIVSAKVGYRFTMLLTDTGRVMCAGHNDTGQLGINSKTNSMIFTDVGLERIVKIVAGPYSSYAIDEDDNLWSWGSNGLGNLGLGDQNHRLVPSFTMSSVKDVSGDSYLTVVLRKDGTVWTAGYNGQGQIGNGIFSTSVYQKTFYNVMSDVKEIATGEKYVIVLTNNDEVYAWGNNDKGQLGDKTTTNRNTPQLIEISEVVKLMGGTSIEDPIRKYLIKDSGSIKTFKDGVWQMI